MDTVDRPVESDELPLSRCKPRRPKSQRVRQTVLAILVFLLLTGCADKVDDTTQAGSQQLRPYIVSCSLADSGDQRQLAIGFESTGATPTGIDHLLPRSRLWSFQYKADAGELMSVGGFPSPPGSIDLLRPSNPDASVANKTPPVAYVTSNNDVGQLTLANLLMGVSDAAHVEADGLSTLRGNSADTPLGRVHVSDVSVVGNEVSVSLRYEWRSDISKGSEEFIPKGSLLVRLRVGGYVAQARGASYVIDRGSTQSVAFLLDPSHQDGGAELVLDEFGLLYPGIVGIDAVAQCN